VVIREAWYVAPHHHPTRWPIDPPKREAEADYECQSGDTGRVVAYPGRTGAGCIASKWAEFMQQLGLYTGCYILSTIFGVEL